MLTNIVIISLISTTLLICLQKWRIFQMWERATIFYKWMPNPCEFCVGFWIGVILTISLGFFVGFSPKLIILPLASASLTRLLYKWVVDYT